MKNYSLKNLSTKSVVGLIIALVALVNTVLLIIGENPINLSDETIYQAVSAIATIGSTFYVAWKNNNISNASLQGQEVTDTIKTLGVMENEEDEQEVE